MFFWSLLTGALFFMGEATGALVRSYEGNFLVAAPDTAVAAESARLAERTRKATFDILGYEAEWDRGARIRLTVQTERTPEGEVPLWTVSVMKGEATAETAKVYPNARNDLLVFHVVGICLEDVAGLARPEAVAPPASVLPLWLKCGVAENLSIENVARFQSFAARIVKGGDCLPIHRLFETKVLPIGEAERELFFKQSGSVVDFLVHRPEGGTKLRQAIAASRAEGGFEKSLLLIFSGDFGTLARLEERWKEFAVRWGERAIRGPRLSLSETKEALDRVLTVSIPMIDRDTLEKKELATDLEGLFRHRNKRTAKRIASEKASLVFQLSLRANRDYGPILQEYLQALTAIGRNDRREFKRHFALAERRRKELEQSVAFDVKETSHEDPPDQ